MNEKDTFRDNPKLKQIGVKIPFTQEQYDEYLKCRADPIYFTKYIQIVTLDEGLVSFDIRDYQKTMIRTIHDNRFVVMKCPRQVGKTITTIAYLLWSTIFQEHQNIAILANRGQTARDILGKYQLAYENLPIWIQQGASIWNKSFVELENGSKITATSTSSSAARSGSYNLVFLDEFAFVPWNIANEFFTSVYPVITAGKKTKIVIVSTPNGMNLFYKIWMDAINKRSDYIPFEIHWSDVPGRDEAWKEQTIKNTSERQFQQEFECCFEETELTVRNKLTKIIEKITFKDLMNIFKGKRDVIQQQ